MPASMLLAAAAALFMTCMPRGVCQICSRHAAGSTSAYVRHVAMPSAAGGSGRAAAARGRLCGSEKKILWAADLPSAGIKAIFAHSSRLPPA